MAALPRCLTYLRGGPVLKVRAALDTEHHLLFRHPPLCLMSFAAGRLGWPSWECDVDRYPPEWLGDRAHTHRAIDDASGYAHLLAHLLSTLPSVTMPRWSQHLGSGAGS